MSYTKHNYQKGDELLASQLNEMDDQIALNEKSLYDYEDKIGGIYDFTGVKGWNIFPFRLEAGNTYTIKNIGTNNVSPIQSRAEDTTTVIETFINENLTPGKTLTIAPEQSAAYIGAYFKGSSGTWSLQIFKNNTYIANTHFKNLVITVGKTGSVDFTSLAEAIEYCNEYDGTTILVSRGSYDILAEYQALHLNDWNTINSGRGLVVCRNTTLIFDPQAFVTCNYEGSDDTIKTTFSAFDIRFGGATFIGLHIKCKNIKYCIHDDQWTWGQPSVSKFIKCHMELDNRNSVSNPTKQCIGGGFGFESIVEIRDCYFMSYDVGSGTAGPLWVSYHSSPSENSQSRIYVVGNYFDSIGTLGLLINGSTTLKTYAFVTNNRFGTDLYLESGYETQYDVTASENVIGEDYEEKINELTSSVNVLEPTAASGDVGKFLKVKTVTGGKVSQYEFDSPPAPTDAQVSTAVNTWLGNNIAQETGYALDRTLSVANAAAPADLVGDIYKKTTSLGINLFNPYTCTLNAALNASTGEVISGTGCVSDYIEIPEGSTDATALYLGTNGSVIIPTAGSRIDCYYYNSQKGFISPRKWGYHQIPSNAKYVRLFLSSTYTPERLCVMYGIGNLNSFSPYNEIINVTGNSIGNKFSLVDYLSQNPSSNVKIIGDSIVQGVGGTGFAQDGDAIYTYGSFSWSVNTSGICWANMFKSKLNELFGVQCLNWGTRGVSTNDFWYYDEMIKSLIKTSDDVIILMIGTNDRNDTKYQNTAIGKERFRANLQAIIRYILSLDKKLICISPIPATIEGDSRSDAHFTSNTVNVIVSSVCKQYQIEYVDLYSAFVKWINETGTSYLEYYSDILHPNDKGYKLIYYLVCNELGIPNDFTFTLN